MLVHTIPPLYDKSSQILILGSFPSVKSREAQFFYGHPQNRFWKVMSAVFEDVLPVTTEDKRAFLLRHKAAVWDVIGSCDIKGSADSTITNVTPNDLGVILKNADIKRIFVNGSAAYKYFTKYNKNLEATKLPSTSPANAAYSLERLISEWKVIRQISDTEQRDKKDR